MQRLTTLEELGRGGFGVVHKVLSGESYFARKTFAPSSGVPVTSYDKLRKRFAREILTQVELGGSEILPVLQYEVMGDEPWFLMPLAEKTYEQQIKEDKLAGNVNINAIADILNAIQYLHDLCYVHRDLNPRNILFSQGKWKLADFGAILPPSGNTITLTENTAIFTESYCAPEQRKAFHKALPAADIYSFGCILDDIFGLGQDHRTPYAQHKNPGVMGMIIEKCTHPDPARRPSINVLREIVLEELWTLGGVCSVTDINAEKWLEQLERIETWDNATYDDFGRFFAQLDIMARSDGISKTWVYAASTPFLTRLTSKALINILNRGDGTSAAIIEKYCQWVRETSFDFSFADVVCERLTAIFDHGNQDEMALAFSALAHLGSTHNRWYVMRVMLTRGAHEKLTPLRAKRLSIELKSDESDRYFKRCVQELKWPKDALALDLQKLC